MSPSTIYVLRFGNTLILHPTYPGTITIAAYGRDGHVASYGRDGKTPATGRDGHTTTKGR